MVKNARKDYPGVVVVLWLATPQVLQAPNYKNNIDKVKLYKMYNKYKDKIPSCKNHIKTPVGLG